MNRRKHPGKFVWFCFILIPVLVMLYSGLRILESTAFLREQKAEETGTVTKTVIHQGKSYFPRQDMTVILLLGIDRTGPAADSGSYNNAGAADMAALLILDEREKCVRILSLNRDTMVEMPVLGLGGKRAGTAVGQLALAHTYGNGLQESCENTRAAVSTLFRNLRIDYYLSMGMDAVPVINDALGGVSVEVTEDFSGVDSTIRQGTQVLRGAQALEFVRSRKDVGTQLNTGRMERQTRYLQSFAWTLQARMEEEEDFLLSVYDTVEPYLVSDLPVNSLQSMLKRYEGYEIAEILSLEGETVLGEEFYEFHPDAEKLEELTMRLFYAPK